MRAGASEQTIPDVGTDGDSQHIGVAPVYRRALALRDMGLSEEAIAASLGVALEAIPALIEVATRKSSSRANAGADGPPVATRSTDPNEPPRKEITCEGS